MICDGSHTTDSINQYYPCRRAYPSDLPEWFDDIIKKNLAKMSAVESKEQEAEQAGAGQPATRPESKSEGSDKPQPEAEGRSR